MHANPPRRRRNAANVRRCREVQASIRGLLHPRESEGAEDVRFRDRRDGHTGPPQREGGRRRIGQGGRGRDGIWVLRGDAASESAHRGHARPRGGDRAEDDAAFEGGGRRRGGGMDVEDWSEEARGGVEES